MLFFILFVDYDAWHPRITLNSTVYHLEIDIYGKNHFIKSIIYVYKNHVQMNGNNLATVNQCTNVSIMRVLVSVQPILL